MAQMVKNLPAMQETQVRALDWEDPLEKGMAMSIPEYWNTSIPGIQEYSIPVFLPRESQGRRSLGITVTVHGIAESDKTERLTLTTDPFFYFRDHVGLFPLKKQQQQLCPTMATNISSYVSL